MWQNKPYYSEYIKIQLLKKAPKEKLIEFLVMQSRSVNDGN